MPSKPWADRATLPRVLSPLDGRVTQREKHYQPPVAQGVGIPYVFDFSADPLAPETSKRLPIPANGPIRVWIAMLTTAASAGDTSVDLVLDGVVIATATIPAGDKVGFLRLGKPASFASALTADLTAVGTGALGLVCCALQFAPVV